MEEKCLKLASVLRTDRHILEATCHGLEKVSGKSGVMEQIIDENDAIVRDRLDFLGLGRNVSAYDVYDALISKVEADDVKIYDALGKPKLTVPSEAQRVINLAKSVSDHRTGFFLKLDVARRFLHNEPPKLVMAALGYSTVDDLLAKEDLLEVYSALRFLEDPNWLNQIFFKQYEKLTPADFEEREVTARVLGTKWVGAAAKFTKKKYHNVSHLKELGVIFVIPVSLGFSGETLRLVALLCHYFNEIYFYSSLFKQFSADERVFANNLVSLLRGDVLDRRLPQMLEETRRTNFLIVQRYLAKDDENDWRLFEPHVNPEALHWQRAEAGIVDIPEAMPNVHDGLHFWKDLGWVGDYFKDEVGHEILVSFNIVDTVMSLVKEREMVKYLYHHQEALWNKIFASYMGEEKMIELIKKNIIRGWFEI
ncbi:MAG: hypothetical protein KGI60_01210 [Patescibacteria group bacterium]|nr:hypothetical protein [Patescibacteria group bacterium]